MVLGVAVCGLIGAGPAAAADDSARAPVVDPVPGLLGIVPCLITTGSAMFCVGIT
ncbi:hypothetical protein [Nocardia bovistercoris]|uniref:Secreted protein n=1 Tax=Nocardia bovistercoris TaxID=2785916 RepID=A0A931N438_9NOCA|nr:hypothetical protein [Nocardia bovistercoris]MBH0778342.1 hypothetical protein [Nocardia bovistercoris]